MTLWVAIVYGCYVGMTAMLLLLGVPMLLGASESLQVAIMVVIYLPVLGIGFVGGMRSFQYMHGERRLPF